LPTEDSEPEVIEGESVDLDPAIASDEYLERFVSKFHVKNGVLKWQAVKLRQNDAGGMSVARLAIGVPAVRAAGELLLTNGLAAFAETVAGVMRSKSHEVVSTPGAFEGHAEIKLGGLDPAWPVPYDPDDATPEALAMVDYYRDLVESFRYRALEEA
jgi:hypothetical protein